MQRGLFLHRDMLLSEPERTSRLTISCFAPFVTQLASHFLKRDKTIEPLSMIDPTASVDACKGDSEIETIKTQRPLLVGQLEEILVKGLEIAGIVTVTLSEVELRVRFHNPDYASMCVDR